LNRRSARRLRICAGAGPCSQLHSPEENSQSGSRLRRRRAFSGRSRSTSASRCTPPRARSRGLYRGAARRARAHQPAIPGHAAAVEARPLPRSRTSPQRSSSTTTRCRRCSSAWKPQACSGTHAGPMTSGRSRSPHQLDAPAPPTPADRVPSDGRARRPEDRNAREPLPAARSLTQRTTSKRLGTALRFRTAAKAAAWTASSGASAMDELRA